MRENIKTYNLCLLGFGNVNRTLLRLLASLEEFRRKPIGTHSPGLQRLLNLLRHEPTGWQTILVCRRPFAEWVLGRMPPDRTDPVHIEDERIFTSQEEAEWEVFRRRWRAHTGEDINIPFRN